LPWFIGQRTLRLLAKPGALQRPEKVKVSRTTVRFAMVYALASAFSEDALAWSHKRATGRAAAVREMEEEEEAPPTEGA
jgi:hypothetical protein